MRPPLRGCCCQAQQRLSSAGAAFQTEVLGMKLLLINDSGEPVACLDDVEGYDVQDSSNVLALLDLLESLIAAAKGGKVPAGPRGELLTNASAE